MTFVVCGGLVIDFVVSIVDDVVAVAIVVVNGDDVIIIMTYVYIFEFITI